MGIFMDTPDFKIAPEMLNLISEIEEFKGQWAAVQNLTPDRLNLLRWVATVESVGSSTRIEGARLSDSEVEKLLSGVGLTTFRSRDEEEVAGYAEAMELVFESFADIPCTENHIKQLHQVLLKYTSKDRWHRGDYKKFSNSVEAFDADGRSLGVIFQTASPFETPFRMSELVEWFGHEDNSQVLHSLLRIAIFVLHFLAIHPFQDGNGRLSRILTTLFLQRAGYLYVPYSSLERIIEENKDRYYVALRRAQSTLLTIDNQLSDWLIFFLRCLREQVAVLSRKLSAEQRLLRLPTVSQDIMQTAREHGRITVRDVVKLKGVNRNTVKDHLKKLVAAGQLIKEGVGKGTWYRPA
jgi:Fic family protein